MMQSAEKAVCECVVKLQALWLLAEKMQALRKRVVAVQIIKMAAPSRPWSISCGGGLQASIKTRREKNTCPVELAHRERIRR